jgi:hypothetical protein
MRGTMEVEQRLQEMLSIDPLSPVTIPGGEVSSENPAFFVSVTSISLRHMRTS